jgi:hypothetical protein
MILNLAQDFISFSPIDGATKQALATATIDAMVILVIFIAAITSFSSCGDFDCRALSKHSKEPVSGK